MGLKSSKISYKGSKWQTRDKDKRQLRAVLLEVTKKLDKESRQKSMITNLCSQLKIAVMRLPKMVTVVDTIVKQTNKDSNFKLEFAKSSVEATIEHFEFKVENLNRLDSYEYGLPPTVNISQLEAIQLEAEETLTFNIEGFEQKVTVDRKLLTLNSDYLKSNLPPDMFTITVRGYSYESIQAVAICLYTKKMYLSLNTIYDIFRFCFELKITMIVEFLSNLCDACDPIYLLAELRKLIIENETGIQYTRLVYDICRNYHCVLKHHAIVDLSFVEMKELMKPRDEIFIYLSLDARCELDVYHAVIDWLLHDQKTRLQHCLNLLRFVRFDELQVQEWKQAFDPNLLQSFPKKLRDLMFQINDTFGTQKVNTKLNVFDVYSKLPRIDNFSEDKRELIEEKAEASLPSNRIDIQLKGKEMKKTSDSRSNKQIEKIVKEALRIYKIIIGTQMLHDLPKEGKHSFSEHSLLLLLGGIQSQVAYKTEQGLFMHQLKPFDTSESNSATSNYVWSPLSQRLPKTLAHFQTLKFGSLVFVIGGIDVSSLLYEKNPKPVNDCCVYSLPNDDWYKIAPMKYSRGYHGSVLINDKIYVFGGITAHQLNDSHKAVLTNTLEVFDIKSNVWSEVYTEGEYPCPRMAFGMEYFQDVIWVIGGLAGSNEKNNYESGDLLSDVWIYSLRHRKWKSVEFWRLPKPRAFMTSIMFKNQIFVIGGNEVEESTENEQRTMRDSRSKSVIIFADLSNGWEEGPTLNMPRIYPAATVCEGTLFVIGGVTHDHKHIDEPVLRSFSGSYEIYNPDINPNWVDNSMVFSVQGACAVTVHNSLEAE